MQEIRLPLTVMRSVLMVRELRNVQRSSRPETF